MKTAFFMLMSTVIGCLLLMRWRKKPSASLHSIDAVVAAYNEEPCLAESLINLLRNRYIQRVICVDDGSTDGTGRVIDELARQYPGRLLAIHQQNTGKGGALMNGISHATAAQVFLTDADTFVDPDSDGLGYLLAEIEAGADAVGGIPSSNLRNAGLLPHVRASLKLPMIVLKRSFQQLLGGAPFIISGACGMFRTEVLRRVGFTDRTKVEDLDLSWTLVAQGYTVRQSNRCVVYPQECNSIREEWKRWRRWIVGYAVCMRLHQRLLFTRFGLFSILPMMLVVLLGVVAMGLAWTGALQAHGPIGLLLALLPWLWVAIAMLFGVFSAIHHRAPLLVLTSVVAVLYVLLAYAIWMTHGVAGLITGREPVRDKPTRYAHVVE
ncbi:glycosyltransferase family 2 protein [Stenotrophomonas sp.]|uniref:glycosyltransferase n=1 Tax=Stenotrophomonas sp. TaxID=69392 RepID=UPI0028AF3846|nr:glycosyltransferase family 2 protein [Stenotrophomonas sp.]